MIAGIVRDMAEDQDQFMRPYEAGQASLQEMEDYIARQERRLLMVDRATATEETVEFWHIVERSRG